MHIFQLNNDTLQETKTLPHDGGVMDVKYSPDGAYLAAADTFRKVYLYQLPEYEVCITNILQLSKIFKRYFLSQFIVVGR